MRKKQSKKPIETFYVGNRVKWLSQSGGSAVVKAGNIVEVIGPGAPPPRDLIPDAGLARRERSYVVSVGVIMRDGQRPKFVTTKLYWPVADRLRRWSGAADGRVLKVSR